LPLTLLAINTFFAAATTPLMNLLDAIGKIKISFLFTIFWTILTWALVPFLSVQMGVEGAALGYAIVGASSIFAIFSVYQYVPFDVSYAIFRPLLASLFMGVILLIIRSNLPATIYSLLLLLVIGAATYSATTFFFFGMALLDDVKKTFATVFAKK
jgi:O-antigen/teichoic acid export membrane protein